MALENAKTFGGPDFPCLAGIKPVPPRKEAPLAQFFHSHFVGIHEATPLALGLLLA
jgi:hypothetical protein